MKNVSTHVSTLVMTEQKNYGERKRADLVISVWSHVFTL